MCYCGQRHFVPLNPKKKECPSWLISFSISSNGLRLIADFNLSLLVRRSYFGVFIQYVWLIAMVE